MGSRDDMIDPEKLKAAARSVKDWNESIDSQLQSAMAEMDLRAVPVEFNTSQPAMDIFAVDGSYSSAWKSPNLPIWVILIRTAVVHRQYDEENIKIRSVSNKYLDVADIINLHQKIVERDGMVEIIHENFYEGNLVTFIQDRSLKEQHELIASIAGREHGVMILYDGSLTETIVKEGEKIMTRILDACENNGNIIVGISKDSSYKKITGIMKDEVVLDAYSFRHKDFTGYFMIDEGIGNRVGTCFARFTPNAMKWFRVDFMNAGIKPLDEILRVIACYSQVNDMPGVPFPPLDAHAIAKLIRDLKEPIERKLMKFLKEEKISNGDIIAGLTDINGNALRGTFHDFLDNFTRVKRRRE